MSEVSTFRLYLMRALPVQFCAARTPGVACSDQPRGSVGPGACRSLELLGGIVGFVRFGTSISAEDGDYASHATVLQIGLDDRSCASYVVRLPKAHTILPRHSTEPTR
jgi:hypothetical protein